MAVFPGQAAAQALTDQIVAGIQDRMKAAGSSPTIACRGNVMCKSQLLPQFYMKRTYQPGWSKEGSLLPQVESLLTIIRNAPSHGLQAKDYQLLEIEAVLADLKQDMRRSDRVNVGKLVNLDLLLTDAFLLYGTHMLSGRIDPNKVYTSWVATPRNADMTEILQAAIEADRVDKVLQGFEPQYVGYERLRHALSSYREIAAKGGWPGIPGSKNVSLRKGSRNSLVPLLWMRLMLTGDLDATKVSEGDRFDDTLQEAVLVFQRRHGLKDDGVVRAETMKALNVAVEKRIRQMELNLERWRWLPSDLGQRYILVNIPDFSLEVINDNQVVMDMRIIVGKRVLRPKADLHTPVFTGRMTHLEINPYWHVPYSIATKELLPEIKKDPAYLAKKNMLLLSGRGKVEPSTVDWTKIHEKNFRYSIRQEPGAFNALSRIKFLFPNRFDVYLHDTPTRNLFKRTNRDFSHGCMRIEKPIDMAIYLLNDENLWSRDKIMATIRKGRNRPVDLPEPIDVHVQYWTAWVDGEGTVQFRDDLYSYDTILERALVDKPQKSSPTSGTARPATTRFRPVQASN